jgi:hypothetical protein
MADHKNSGNSFISIESLRILLKSQYRAALAMLKQAIERCPDDLWIDRGRVNPFWQNAYHALFFTHLYLEPDEAAFRPWQHHREEYQFLGNLPWPPHHPPKIGEPYTREEVLEYWRICDGRVDGAVDALDLQAQDCGFWWYKMSKLEHQIVSIRHIQHHTAQLADRLRARAGLGIDWKGAGRTEK